MDPQIPIPLQVALYTASAAIVVLTAVLVNVVLRLKAPLDRVVTALTNLEAELTPLARETRVVVDDVRALSDQTQLALGAVSGMILPPVRAINRTVQIAQAGATAFLRALWSERPPTRN
jgi:uncharacterized protein YoxC